MQFNEILLSEYGRMSRMPSPVNRMMTAFAENFRPDQDINLGVGYVNEDTIPRDRILEAMREVLSSPERYPVALNYGGSRGSQNLIDSLKRFHLEHDIGGITERMLAEKEIIIGPNGATSLLEGIADVLAPGIVITSDPKYYIYCNFLERRGFDIVAVPEDDEGIMTELVTEKLRDLGENKNDVRFIYVVTVNNPTGTILSNARRVALVRIAGALSRELGRAIPVFFDKAYENLVHDPSVPQPQSGFLYDEGGLVYEIGTLSKIFAPALRIGYLIGNDGPFLRAMVQKTSDVGFSASLLAQEIASYLLDHHVADQITKVNAGYRTKARQVKTCIERQLGGEISRCTGGQAGFYFYLTFNEVETTEGSHFFTFLARTTGDTDIDGPPGCKKTRVIYVPGEFCVHPRGDLVEVGKRQLRLSYGFEEVERICDAIRLMREAVAYALSIDAC